MPWDLDVYYGKGGRRAVHVKSHLFRSVYFTCLDAVQLQRRIMQPLSYPLEHPVLLGGYSESFRVHVDLAKPHNTPAELEQGLHTL